jgi:hypothetical protein
MKIQDFPEDETILSAYLDGELEFELSQAVESSLASDPQLAEQLRRLVEVRELLAGLGRPDPIDLSGEILDRIRHLRKDRRHNHPLHALVGLLRSPRRMAGVGAVAASLVIGATSFLTQVGPSRPEANRPVIARAKASQSAASLAEVPRSTDLGRPSPAAGSQTEATRKPISVPIDAIQSAAMAPVSVPLRRGADHSRQDQPADPRDRVRPLLDSPKLRHVFLVADQIRGASSEKISGLIEQTVRDDFFSITVAQGIVIDPAHPAQAQVFAFTIDESELEHFRTRLNAAIDVRSEEFDASPELVTQLTEIGEVRAYSPPAVGEIVIPRSDVALKSKQPDAPPNPEPVSHIVSTPILDSPATNLQPRPTQSKPKIELREVSDDILRAKTEELANHSIDQPKSPRTRNEPDAGGSPRHDDSDPSSRKIVVLVWISPPSSSLDQGSGPP